MNEKKFEINVEAEGEFFALMYKNETEKQFIAAEEKILEAVRKKKDKILKKTTKAINAVPSETSIDITLLWSKKIVRLYSYGENVEYWTDRVFKKINHELDYKYKQIRFRLYGAICGVSIGLDW